MAQQSKTDQFFDDPWNQSGNYLQNALSAFDPRTAANTAAQGAREAQQQANSLSQIQWDRQMQGMRMAQGYVGDLQGLYNSIYSPGHGQAAPGGAYDARTMMPSPGGYGGPQAPGGPPNAAGALPPGNPPPPAGPVLTEKQKSGSHALANDTTDAIPGYAQLNRGSSFVNSPGLTTGAELAGTLAPGLNATKDFLHNAWSSW